MVRTWYANMQRAFFAQLPLGNIMEKLRDMTKYEAYAEGHRTGFSTGFTAAMRIYAPNSVTDKVEANSSIVDSVTPD